MNNRKTNPLPKPNQSGLISGAAADPIFIHSLFRSGSTWLFNTFRHANADYWCYQEPFNEALRLLSSDPDSVLSFHGEVALSLRHPPLSNSYFFEIHAVREHIGDSFHPCISYTSFFDTTGCPALDDYTSRLIRHAHGRPVLQCCRSFGRVAHLRQHHGGIHIYLWRNPWDQWWSYQVNDYFDTTSLAILHANNTPLIIELLKRELGTNDDMLRGPVDDFAALSQVPFSAEGHYLAFYGLWLYSLIENRLMADVDINIDQLATDLEYRDNVTAALAERGVVGLDLSTCAIPQAQFGPEDKEFFERTERRVHQLFAIAGYNMTALHEAIRLQSSTQPQPDANTAVRDAARARSIARRYANRSCEAVRKQWQTVTFMQQAIHKRDETWAKARETEARTRQAERGRQTQDMQTQQAIHERDEARAKAKDIHKELRKVYASKSWRITFPLRRTVRLMKSLLRLLLLVSMRWVLRHTRIKAVSLRMLTPFPRITRHLHALAFHHGLLRSLSEPSLSAEARLEAGQMPILAEVAHRNENTVPRDLPIMTAQARQIYAQLVNVRTAHRGHEGRN